jgi:hypothetical protein
MTVGEIDTIGFDYEGGKYTALVRCREQEDGLLITTTIMNGEMEKRLFGYHQYIMKGQHLSPACHCDDLSIGRLQSALGDGLRQYLENCSWNITPTVKAEVEYAQLPSTF